MSSIPETSTDAMHTEAVPEAWPVAVPAIPEPRSSVEDWSQVFPERDTNGQLAEAEGMCGPGYEPTNGELMATLMEVLAGQSRLEEKFDQALRQVEQLGETAAPLVEKFANNPVVKAMLGGRSGR